MNIVKITPRIRVKTVKDLVKMVAKMTMELLYRLKTAEDIWVAPGIV